MSQPQGQFPPPVPGGSPPTGGPGAGGGPQFAGGPAGGIAGPPAMVAGPRPAARAVRLLPVAGTPYALAYPQVPPITSGPAIGSMVAGIASILVGLVMTCLGLSGARAGWGALVAGAFAILSLLIGAAAIGVGTAARRIIRRAAGTVTGRGMATAGLACGWVGAGLSVLGFAGALAATAAG